MSIILFLMSILLSLFSTIVMSYVSLATPIGPWIAPTLVFIVLLISRIFIKIENYSIAYIVSAGSVGGILATACAFSFPTIYFLDPMLFNEWMSAPLFFSSMLGCFSFLAGAFGILVADVSEKSLMETQKLSFPIGQLIHKMIIVQNQIHKAYQLMIGFIVTMFFSLLQSNIVCANTFIPKSIMLVNYMKIAIFSLPRIIINIDTMPMVLAIGFVTGHVIALPLMVGLLANIFIVSPLQQLFFTYISSMEFMLAFCSGIVFFITVMSIVDIPKSIIQGLKKVVSRLKEKSMLDVSFSHGSNLFFLIFTGIGLVLFLSYFKFPWYVQLYLIVCSVITTYQIAAIAGRVGLALLGRFATFVMVPAMLIFNINYVHMVFIATFVEMAGGVAADILFGRKLAQLSDLSRVIMRRYQLLGLVVASLSIGIIFWIFINHFGLGSPELFAYRAQSRQLLIQAKHFDWIVLSFGALFGLCLRQINLNPMLVLGGLLMPFDITLGLVAGGLLAILSVDKEQWYPFWSGVFASNSLCMLARALI